MFKKDSSTTFTTLNYFGTTLKQLTLVFGNNAKLKELIDYFNQLIFMHFTLYKYVFTVERDSAIVYEEKLLQAPPPPKIAEDDDDDDRLKDSKTYEQWLYEERVREIDEREKRANEMHDEAKRRMQQSEESLIRFIRNDAYGYEQPLSEEVRIFF